MACLSDSVFTRSFRSNLGSASLKEPVKLTSDEKKENKEVNIIDPNTNISYKTKNKFTGSYTEVNPEFVREKCSPEMFLWRFIAFCFSCETCSCYINSHSFGLELTGNRHRRRFQRFQPHWIFPRPAESWLEIHLY